MNHKLLPQKYKLFPLICKPLPLLKLLLLKCKLLPLKRKLLPLKCKLLEVGTCFYGSVLDGLLCRRAFDQTLIDVLLGVS